MVMSVTRGGRNRRGRLAASLRAPRAHALTKAVGDTITGSWSVTNTGGTPVLGFLDILFPGPGTAFLGPTESIPGGATVTLTVSGVISALVPGNTYDAQLRIRALAPATVAPGGIHDFTLTITALPADLSVSGPAIINGLSDPPNVTVPAGGTLTGQWTIINSGVIERFIELSFWSFGATNQQVAQGLALPVPAGGSLTTSLTWTVPNTPGATMNMGFFVDQKSPVDAPVAGHSFALSIS